MLIIVYFADPRAGLAQCPSIILLKGILLKGILLKGTVKGGGAAPPPQIAALPGISRPDAPAAERLW